MENTFGINIIPENDEQRINALRRYQILETPSEESFDDIARLATEIFGVPISLISLVDRDEVYFKANVGMDKAKRTSRGVSLCSLAVLNPETTVFTDPLNEPCLLTNPNVIGDFGLKFYAGAPITTHDGFRIGTLCIIDQVQRSFDEREDKILKRMAKVVMAEIEMRLSAIQEVKKQLEVNEEVEAMNEELNASNEELVRSKREIELLNQELTDINTTILETNEELSLANAAFKTSQEELILANAKLADSEELKDLAIEQAQLGLWYIDANTRDMISSPRLKDFFGYPHSANLTFEAAMEQVREDYREKVSEEVENAIRNHKPYNIEYPIISFSDKRLRWVKAMGRLNHEDKGRKSYLSGTVMDITEQKEDEQRKNDFISMVSHELKTPLTSMAGYVQLLERMLTASNNVAGVKILQRAANQTRKMNQMVDGFLNSKRAETGKIPLDLSSFDMADLLREAEMESMATISSHHVIFAPVEPTQVHADREKLGQVISNLLTNAVKYSPAGSTINVACIQEGLFAKVTVKDEGMGVTPFDQEKLFSRFHRIERKETENIKGFGIGLYLCAEIIRRHHGEIGVESGGVKGSVFHFTLPLRQIEL
ncbi:ATP-binding protein [Pedobacter frigidisoli]|uniref:ATP-binding protein n=1 Tax=Pedobacter frigidisoli TaxID=2530455 RepID=UPI00292E7012|nr:ATP-binding protein [Pedobacter frigidisoli]